MPTFHDIVVDLSPGIERIGVAVQNAQGGFTPQTRAKVGDTVRFVVTPYTGFNITSVSVYYADEYDDTVNVNYTSVAGADNTYDFTMVEATAYVRAEASSGDVPSDFPYVLSGDYPDGTVNQNDTNYTATVTGKVNTAGLVDGLIRLWGLWGITLTSVILPSTVLQHSGFIYSIVTLSSSGWYYTMYLFPPDFDITGRTANPPNNNLNYFDTNNVTIVQAPDMFPMSGSTLDLASNSQVYPSASPPPIRVGWWRVGSADTTMTVTGSNATYELSITSAQNAIRYVLSPENSGEVNGPETYSGTSFAFTFRIKAGYSLRRITPFAVGDGSAEDDILHSDEYDGQTRTYTVTVVDIPDWAKGVNVLIETINQNSPNPGPKSQPGGGNGTFDDSSDSVPIEPMPSISAADAGLITLFRPSLSELKGLGAYLWTNIEDFITNLQKMFSNPMDTIIALNILPGVPSVGASRNIRLGLWETNISMPPVLSQWYEINFGSVNVNEFWGSALDYSPNTKIHAMLPFIGSVQLNTDDVMGTTVGLVYRIDLLSGHLVAMITVNDNVLYQFTGECAVAVPLTGADWSRVYGAIAGTIGAVAIGAAGAAAAGAGSAGLSQTAAVAQHAAAQADFDYMSAAISGAGQSQLRALDSSARQLNAAAMNAVGRKNAAEAAKVAGAVALGSNTVNQIMGAKFQIAHSGTISGSAGLLGLRRPYIYIEYPNQSLPENYKHFYGYPSNMYANLGSLTGFTQCYQVLLTGVNGTDGEIAEILELLKGGVYL